MRHGVIDICQSSNHRIPCHSVIASMSPLKSPHTRRLTNLRQFLSTIFIAAALLSPVRTPAESVARGPAGGIRIVSVKASSTSVGSRTAQYDVQGDSSTPVPPLEGPIMIVPITLTDQRSPEFEFFATAHAGVDGSPLPGATANVALAVLDSGAGTHLVSYPDSVAFGLQGSYLTENTFQAGGVDGTVDLAVSQPVGFFVHGLQDLDPSGNPQPSLMFGQGNFACGVNTLGNYELGSDVPTLIGAPFMLYFAASIRNSEPLHVEVLGKSVSSPSITFFADPADPQIPVLAHKIFLETRPTGEPAVAYLFLFDAQPYAPSTILAGQSASALFFTASSMSFTEGANISSGKMMVDTGAQATLLSEIAAAELDLDLQNPDFEVEVQGLSGGTVTAPGFYIDSATIPAGGGAVSWANIPVIILNLPSPEGGTLYGIFGNNLTATRDLVFNGAASPPYLGVTAPIVSPVLTITAVRPTGSGGAEIDWRAEPAPPVLYLDMCEDLGLTPPAWTTVATGELPTITGTMTVTGPLSRNYFRLWTPQ